MGAFDPLALQAVLDGRFGEVRDEVRALLRGPSLERVSGVLDRDAYRAKVTEWLRLVVGSGLGVPGFPVEYGGRGDPGANVASFETLAHGDLSLLVKFGVQFGLFGGEVQNLGTSVHHERYLHAIASFELPGCFAMTEADHGSNVQALRTTAVWDGEAGEFVINTPDDTRARSTSATRQSTDGWRRCSRS